MTLNTDELKAGDIITVGRWLKKLGHFAIEKNGKPRNVYALCKKGKYIPAMKCEAEEAETIVNDNGEFIPFKRAFLDTEVKFAETVINVFPLAFWNKATVKNLFLGMLEEFQKEQKNGMDSQLSREADKLSGNDSAPSSSGLN